MPTFDLNQILENEFRIIILEEIVAQVLVDAKLRDRIYRKAKEKLKQKYPYIDVEIVEGRAVMIVRSE